MRIAILLYGQPRDYMRGYSHIMNFIRLQTNIEVDFFYHAWILEKGNTYDIGAFADKDKQVLRHSDNIKDILYELYSPKCFEYELQKLDWTIDTDTIGYVNLHPTSDKLRITRTNISQAYTRNKVRNIFNAYLQSTGIIYDTAVITRFDLAQPVDYILNGRDLSKVYVGKMHLPRKIFPDHFIIAPAAVIIKWFTLFDDYLCITNSKLSYDKMKSYNEVLSNISEAIIFAKYLLEFNNVNDVCYAFDVTC